MPRCLARVMISSRLRFHLCDRQAAQAVVGAELEHQHVDVAVERPVQPAQAAGRRVAGHAGIHDLVAIALRVQPRLNQRRHRLLARQAESGREAVAEEYDPRTRRSAALAAGGAAAAGASAAHPRQTAPLTRTAAATPQPRASDRRWPGHSRFAACRISLIVVPVTFTIDPGSLARALERRLRLALTASRSRTRCGPAAWMSGARTPPSRRRLPIDSAGWTRSTSIDAAASSTPHVRRVGPQRAASPTSSCWAWAARASRPRCCAQVIGVAPGFPRFRVLDSVDPDAVRAAMARAGDVALRDREQVRLDHRAERRWPPRPCGASATPASRTSGSRFIAITDEGTALHRRAVDERFRDVFINPADIGGRFSALSLFGLVPAALMGIDVDALLAAARTMAERMPHRRSAAQSRAGAGRAMAAAARTGRDKLDARRARRA